MENWSAELKSEQSQFIFSTIQNKVVDQILNGRAQRFNKKILYDIPYLDEPGFIAKHQAQNASLVYFTLKHLADLF